MSDDRLRHAYESLMRERAKRAPDADVSLDAMRDVLERRGSEESRLALIDRIMAHPRLAGEFAVLRAAHEAAQPAPRVLFSIRALAMAAGILTVVALGTWYAQRDGTQEDRMRGARVGIPLYAPAETVLADSVGLFSWAGMPDARQYIFELNTAAGDPLYSTVTTDSTVALPDSVRLTPGTAYFWWVRSITRDGELSSPLRPLVTRTR